MDLKYTFYIAAKPDDVWKVLVSSTETKKVYYGSEIQSTFEVGSPMKYVGPGISGKETVHIHGKVLKFEPKKTFSYTCKVGEAYGAVHANFESRVTYELEPVGTCTKLTLTHDQWTEGDPSYENTARGWWIILSAVKTLVETGKSLDLSGVEHVGSGPKN